MVRSGGDADGASRHVAAAGRRGRGCRAGRGARDRCRHDWLVVTELGEDELDWPELEDPEPESVDPPLVVPLLLDPVLVDPVLPLELDPDDVLD